ncbi:MAG: DUF4886 domain-containing protein [Clostridia bacterium]|nr:DUF4886 domain-containing protein [Clostridia bacterium]
MKLLSIGNSFSNDAHRWLHKLAEQNGVDLYTVDADIGGCTLERHWNNVSDDPHDYYLQINGESVDRMISLSEALSMEQWDVITIQQASPFSGMPQTFFPYITDLSEYLRKLHPQAKLFFHQTWAYEIDSGHGGFPAYDCNQQEMFRRIKDCSEMASKVIDAEILPTGSIIQKLRETVPEFNYAEGGMSLCRDGFHLSLDYGRYAAAAIWVKTLTGITVKAYPMENFDIDLLGKIVDIVNQEL